MSVVCSLYPNRPVFHYLMRSFVVATVREELARLGMIDRVAEAHHLDQEICIQVAGIHVDAHEADTKAPGRLFHRVGMSYCLFSWPCCGRSGSEAKPFPTQTSVALVIREDGLDRVLTLTLAG